MGSRNKKILGSDGHPINSHDEEVNLPVEVQALIETRMNSAIDNLRERNRDDLKDLARKHTHKWRYLALISSAIAIITIFYAPHQIITWIGKQVDTKLTEPRIQESADRLIDSKMAQYVSDKMQPLNQQAIALDNRIDEMNESITQKQTVLEKQQRKLSDQLHIRELAIAAKAGSREAYTELLNMIEKGIDANDLLIASLKEIEQYYDVDRNQLNFSVLVNNETFKDPGYATDEVIFVLRDDPEVLDAAINTLSRLKSKAAIGELCRIISTTQNLRAAARATRAIEKITGERIRPLDFDKVQYWWQNNKDKKIFLGNYDEYCEVVRKMIHSPKKNSLYEFIDSLTKTIDSDPDALHSMCLKAGFLLMIDELTQAENLLNEVRKKRSDYYWLYVWEAALNIKQGDLDSAIESLNFAYEKSPTSIVEKTVRYWNIFDPIEDNPKVAWPSKDKQDSQQNVTVDVEDGGSIVSKEDNAAE